MIHANTTRSRRGFTLIELLVVMALIAGLAAMAMVVAPGAMNKDRAATAVTQIQGALQISRARAIRDGLPRGVRFIATGVVGNVQSTEYQYIEAPQVFVPNPGAPLAVTPYALPGQPPPYVEFNYTTGGGGGNVTSRTCTIYNLLNPDHGLQVVAGGTLYLPTLGTWHQIIAAPAPSAAMIVTLATYPDEQLGAELKWRSYHFGLYGPVRALLGEPVMQLPQRTCIDLTLSSPSDPLPLPAPQVVTDYDILFAPSGLLVSTGQNGLTNGAGQVFLWVRDPNKPSTLNQGGEQLIVAIKAKSGGIGAGPVDWGADPYFLAKKALSGQ